MPSARLPINEAERLRALYGYEIVGSEPEAVFDEVAKLAAAITGAPIALVTFVDADRQCFKARIGTTLSETPRDVAFCAHSILGSEMQIVPDATADARFSDNPLVTGQPFVRFYAGMPLITPAGLAIGTLCVIDFVCRELDAAQKEALRVLARQVMGQLELRRTNRSLVVAERLASDVARQNAFFAAIIQSTDDAVVTKDLDGIITSWNAGAERVFGWKSGEVIGKPITVIIPQDRLSEEPAILRQIREGQHIEHFESVRKCKDGRLINVSATISPVHDQNGTIVGISKVARDVTPQTLMQQELQRAKEDADRIAKQMRHDSRHDGLTGLANRLLFHERVERSIMLARRRHYNFAILFLDLDRFKIINDSLGHAAGDTVLREVAARIRRAIRPADMVDDSNTVARLGGDEFTVLLENLRRPEDAARVAQRIRASLAQPIEYEGNELTVTVSIGIVACGGGALTVYESAKDLLRDADAAMYKAKESGKDRYVIFDQAMHLEVVARMLIEAQLRRAVDRGELELHYQPIVSLQDSQTVGMEALVRWKRGDQLISPGEFIPVAEDTGIIIPLGEWVVRKACRQLAEWRKLGGAMADVTITVNVSPRQLHDAGFLNTLQSALAATGIPPKQLGLEITESSMMQDAEAAREKLSEIQQITGVRLYMDDFGTGYSSLACLQQFPINVLKIDRAFVRDVIESPRDANVMRTIITLAHCLGMKVVAEGVETAEQAEFLSNSGCDFSQGFLFSRPLLPGEAARFVMREHNTSDLIAA